jgi:hypothetical protein
MPSTSQTPDAVRMRRSRRHASGDHQMCLPSMCQLTLAELMAVRALLAERLPAGTVRFARRSR